MKSIAFVFTKSPHGTSVGREGLDAVLAVSALSDRIALFFIGDGVLQLLNEQHPSRIFSRDYIATFGILPLYDVETCYLCTDSLAERGLSTTLSTVLPVECLTTAKWREKLDQYDIVMTF